MTAAGDRHSFSAKRFAERTREPAIVVLRKNVSFGTGDNFLAVIMPLAPYGVEVLVRASVSGPAEKVEWARRTVLVMHSVGIESSESELVFYYVLYDRADVE